MSQNESRPVVGCTLTEKQAEQPPTVVESTLKSLYVGHEMQESGVSIRFAGTDVSLHAVAQFASNELKCCSFATYEITISPPYEQTVLTITGPEGTRELFRAGLITLLEGDSTVSMNGG